MIQNETRLRVADYTGARDILVIRVRGGSGRRVGGAFVAAVSPKSVSGISQNTKDAHNLREGETTAPRP